MSETAQQLAVKHRREEGEEIYEDIPVYATPDLHADVMKIIEKHRLRLGLDPLVLDLGAGRGAFSKRLANHGFKVEAIELEGAPWDVPEISVRFIDFCAPALPKDILAHYDLIVSTEVIEHIPDPVMFMKNIYEALKPEGIAIITNPNPLIASSIAILSWKGEYPLFDYEHYWSLGHRNILPDFLLKAFAEHAGFEILTLDYLCEAKWPLKLWLSFIPIFPAILWHYIRYHNRWNKKHNLLIVTKPLQKDS